MTPDQEIKMGLAILELLLKYLPEAAAEIIGVLSKEAVTLDDIRALRDKIQHPDDIFPATP